MAGDFLEEMARASRARCEAARSREGLGELRARCGDAGDVVGLDDALAGGFFVIAEVKRVSPAEGRLDGAGDGGVGDVEVMVASRARMYASAGAGMVSVLSEPTRFGGSLGHVRAAADGVDVAVMRKDFLVDAYQVYEARSCGASAVLVIVRMLDDGVMRSLVETALGLGMHVLLEAFDGADLDRAGLLLDGLGVAGGGGVGGGGRVLVGLNCRDLSTLAIEPARFEALAGGFPGGVVRIAESGVRDASDAAWVSGLGYDGALVGTALMRSADAPGLLRSMVEAGADGRGARGVGG